VDTRGFKGVCPHGYKHAVVGQGDVLCGCRERARGVGFVCCFARLGEGDK